MAKTTDRDVCREYELSEGGNVVISYNRHDDGDGEWIAVVNATSGDAKFAAKSPTAALSKALAWLDAGLSYESDGLPSGGAR